MDLVYQPIVDLSNGIVSKVEALLRPSNSAGRVADFIIFAETSGRMKRLTNEVLDEALSGWRKYGRPGVAISVNLSLANLDETDLPRRVEKALKRFRCDPASLWFELGERAQEMSDATRIACMRAVSALGVRFSLDSFGSDLSQVTISDLGRLPWRELKIGRDIVAAASTDMTQRHRISSTVAIAKRLGMSSTAKGVEDRAVATLVTRLGCTFGQGHYYAKPAPPEAIGDMLDALRARTWVPLEA